MKKLTTVQEVEERINYFRQRARRKNHGIMYSPVAAGISIGRFVDEYDSDKFYLSGNYTINPKTLKITVKGSLWLGHFPDTELGLDIEKVTGDFKLRDCPNLNTLVGFPKSVNNISIQRCPNLTFLDYIPTEISGIVFINRCSITELSSLSLSKGIKKIHLLDIPITDFSKLDCSKLTKLEELRITKCDKLTSLKGLESLVIKKKMKKDSWSGKYSHNCGLYLRNLQNLTTLEYLPKEIDGNLNIDEIPISDLEYLPKVVKGTLNLENLTISNLNHISIELGALDAHYGMNNLVDISNLTKVTIHNRLDLDSKKFPRRVIKSLLPNYNGVIGRH